MRETKFRAWDKRKKQMIHVLEMKFLFEDETGIWVSGYDNEEVNHEIFPEDLVLEEYTGKKDKHGTEIYEEDEIYFSISRTQHFRGTVVWDDKRCGWSVEISWEKADALLGVCTGYEFNWSKANRRLVPLDSDCFGLEIIGNIHQNPELLESK